MILGYVVRWVSQGVGCSTVPDIDGIGDGDLATLRISSQHVANWLHHGLVSEAQVTEAMQRMAVAVDGQGADDAVYEPMAVDYELDPVRAALSLVLDGRVQERLHRGDPRAHRRAQKAASATDPEHEAAGTVTAPLWVRHKIAGDHCQVLQPWRILEALGDVLGHLVGDHAVSAMDLGDPLGDDEHPTSAGSPPVNRPWFRRMTRVLAPIASMRSHPRSNRPRGPLLRTSPG